MGGVGSGRHASPATQVKRHTVPTVQLKLLGNYKPDKHGRRVDDVIAIAGGKPEPPANMSEAGAQWWAWSVDSLPAGIYTKADTGLLHQALNWWVRWAAAADADDAVEMERATRNYVALSKVLYFGPVGRTKLVSSEPVQVDGISRRERGNG